MQSQLPALNQNLIKRILSLIAFTLLTTSMYAEKIVATYTLSGTRRNVEAGIDSNGALNVFIQVVGEDSDYVMIRVEGEEDIKRFHSQQAYCKEKFIEWEQVAKRNKVYDFKKEIDARFPNVEVWWVGLEWYSSNKTLHLELMERQYIGPMTLSSRSFIYFLRQPMKFKA